MTIETNILAIIKGKKRAPLTKALLRVMSHGYQAGVSMRNFAYLSFLPKTKLSIPVISVGNIVAGGSGKTPFVQYLAKELCSQMQVAILSRGYRRKGKQMLLVEEKTSASSCGDEPYLLARKLPDVSVIVGANRAKSGSFAIENGEEVVILDDGMQHRALHRDYEIIVMHADDLFGYGYFLPRGFLRDSPKRLSEADLIVINGIVDKAHFEKIAAQIRPFSKSPLTAMQLRIENSVEMASKKVAAFCSVAAPERFFQTLKTMGCEILIDREKPDHIAFEKEELECLANQAVSLGAQCLVCTEKDFVKLPSDIKLQLPIFPVKVEAIPIFGREHLEKLIKEVMNER